MIIILSKRYKFLNYISIIHLLENINAASYNNLINKNHFLSLLFCSYIIYNYYIKENLNWPINLCGNRKLTVDLHMLNKVFYKILSNKDLNNNNNKNIYNLFYLIKQKNKNR